MGNGWITGDRTPEVGTNGNRTCNGRDRLAKSGVECSPDLPRGLRRVSESAPISRRRVGRHDMEVQWPKYPPYSASLVGIDDGSVLTLLMNPLDLGALVTEKDCEVCSKKS